MKQNLNFSYLPLFLMLLLFGCGDDTFTQKPTIVIQEEMATSNVVNKVVTKPIEKKVVKKAVPREYKFTFKNLKTEENKLEIKDNIYNFKNIEQPIVIVNIMATWCPPCRGQIPHLSKLQHKFKENIFVISLLVHDDISLEKLEKFTITEKIRHYLSVSGDENLKFTNMLMPKLGLSEDFPMPITVVFLKGKYFTHYEGMVPEEMIESDIKQLLKKIKR